MKARHCVFLAWAFLHAASPGPLLPNLAVGGFGNGSLEFRHPGALQAHQDILYVVDEGNDRIQKISPAGKYLGESHSDLTGIQDLCLDVAGMIYVSFHGKKGITQLRGRDFVPLAFHPVETGHLAHSPGSALTVLSRQEMQVWQYSFAAKRTKEWQLPTTATILRPLDVVSQKGRVWVLTQKGLLKFDPFGGERRHVRFSEEYQSGFACRFPGRGLFLVLDNACFVWSGVGPLIPAGRLAGDIRVGGIAVAQGQLWLSDRNQHRLLRFGLSEKAPSTPSRREDRDPAGAKGE